MFKMREPIKFHWKNTHHLYLGLCILLLALLFGINEHNNLLENNIMLLGLYITVDDVVEHTITANTPIRIITEKLLEPTMKIIKIYIKK
jgi:hypothetical protein